MNVQSLLGEIPVSQFIADYLHRLPFALPGAAHPVCRFGTWETLGRLIADEEADLMVVRDGERYGGKRPATLDEARALSAEGHTLLVRHAERKVPELGSLAREFSRTFRGAVNIHLYATPPGRHGFSWHYDAEDVFIMQTTGVKQYSLRKNTVNPWPLEETLPADMRYERELMPLMQVLLKGGDLLYIPCGYWHKAEADETEEAAISLALGVMSRSAMDVFDLLRPQLLDSLLWRQRLPVPTSTDPQSITTYRQSCRQLIDQLGQDLLRTMTSSRFLDQLLQAHQDQGSD